MEKNENTIFNKKNFWDSISVIISLLAFIFSIISFSSSNDLVKYQISQERLPNIICTDNQVQISIQQTFLNEIESHEGTDKFLIPIYNIGVGTALNCEIEWDNTSVKNACLEFKKLLTPNIKFKTLDEKDSSIKNFSIDSYNYIFESETLSSIWFYDSNINKYKEITFSEGKKDIKYILPLTEKEQNNYIEMPEIISNLLLELANENIADATITLSFDVLYQDIDALERNKQFYVDISIENIIEEDAEVYCTFNFEVYEM